jgi:uncharacterized protein YvpB
MAVKRILAVIRAWARVPASVLVSVLVSTVLCLLLAFPTLAQAQDIPERAMVTGVVGYPQRFTLSCESRSAVDWAGYWGVSIREKKFLNSLPRSDNPETGFVGSPSGEWGGVPPNSYGVHAGPVAAALRSYGLQAEAYRGLSWDELRAEIATGRPVIVWVIGQMWPGSPQRYSASDGQATTVARYEHTMILVGYDPHSVRVVDAFSGRTLSYPLRTFLASWKTLGRMAILGSAAPAEVREPPPAPALPAELSVHSFFPMAYKTPSGGLVDQTLAEAPAAYTVKRGDYLTDIARRFGLDWQRLASLNGIEYPYVIRVGQTLRFH